MKPLNPIMAVLVVASVGASPLRTLAADGKKADAPVAAVAASEDKNPVNALAKILAANPEARKDAGKRIEEFLLNADNGNSFVSDDVDTKALGAVAREWGETKAPVGSVAMLYFVVGPGMVAPGWVMKDTVLTKTFVSGMKWEGRLRAALADWTGKSQITKKKEKSAVTAFLADASTKAAAVFSEKRTKDEIAASAAANDTTAPVVPSTNRSPRSGLDGAARQYTLEDLYVDGAVVKEVGGPNDPNSRRISMKIYSKRVDGVIVNEIGIFDITDSPDDIYGQRFPIGTGKQSFVLDDRTPGHKKYELTFGPVTASGERSITFARPDAKEADALATTTTELFKKRADQAATLGNIVNVGGEDFYVLPQGGARSALALFSKAVVDGREGGINPRLLEPALFAEVGKRGPNGRNQNLQGKPHLGTVGKLEYHLEFNKDTGVWEAKEGAGDPPPKPAGDGTGAGNGDAGTGGSNPAKPQGEMSIADLEALLIKTGNCKKDPKQSAELAPELKDKYGIVSCNNDVDGLRQIVLTPKTAATPDQQMAYGNSGDAVLKSARFFDHYLVLEFDTQQQYLDLLKMEKDANNKDTLALSGWVTNKIADKFTGAGALVDALKHYVYVGDSKPSVADSEAFAEIPKRVSTVLAGKAYNLKGEILTSGLVVVGTSNGLRYHIWPKVILPQSGDAVTTPSPYTSLSGPASVMDGDVSSVDDKFKLEFQTADLRTAKIVGDVKDAEAKDIALYVTEDPNGTDKINRYFVIFRYNSPDPKDVHVFRHRPVELFNKDNPYPGNVQIDGLVKQGAAVASRGAAGYKFVSGSTKEKGVFAMFQNKQVSSENAQNGKANCVGPLVWWGLASRDAALQVCKDGKF